MTYQGESPTEVALQMIERSNGAPKGSGAAAMRRLVARADELGVTVRLMVEKTNIRPLVPYYRAFGFKKLIIMRGDYYMYR